MRQSVLFMRFAAKLMIGSHISLFLTAFNAKHSGMKFGWKRRSDSNPSKSPFIKAAYFAKACALLAPNTNDYPLKGETDENRGN